VLTIPLTPVPVSVAQAVVGVVVGASRFAPPQRLSWISLFWANAGEADRSIALGTIVRASAYITVNKSLILFIVFSLCC
jgi:hypothetical protein